MKEVRFNTTFYGYPEHVYTDSELVDQEQSTTDIWHFKVSN